MKGELAQRKCEPCEAGTPPLPEESARDLQSELDGAWERESNKSLHRRFEFKNFRDAFGLGTRVALLAEDQGHHPDLEVGWGYLVVKLTTHTAGGLTDNDFIMAAKIDRLQ